MKNSVTKGIKISLHNAEKRAKRELDVMGVILKINAIHFSQKLSLCYHCIMLSYKKPFCFDRVLDGAYGFYYTFICGVRHLVSIIETVH